MTMVNPMEEMIASAVSEAVRKVVRQEIDEALKPILVTLGLESEG